ncbi:MAG: MFS transporter [Leptolyngbyaceae cyanobacterium]
MPTVIRQRVRKLGLLASLYISQLIPLAFLGQALPIYLRQQGASLTEIGLLSLLSLPWALKFLWAPLIDRYGFTRFGHYRFWIICFQLTAAVGTVACAFVPAQGSVIPLLIGILLLFFVCASQDVATDALEIGLLTPQERGFGNGVQTAGNYLGIVMGGGGLLLLLDRWGWQTTLLTMATVMGLALIPVLGHREKVLVQPVKLQRPKRSIRASLKGYLRTFVQFCRRPGMAPWLLIVVSYLAGPYMVLAMFRPLLVDIGLSVAEIGLLLGVVGSTAGVFGALVAGFFIAALGRKRSLLVFGTLRVLVLIVYLLPALGITQLPLIYAMVIGLQFTSSMANTTLYTIMMDKSRAETAGTDYTLQNSVIALSGEGVTVTSGILGDAIGYVGVFAVAIAIALASLALVARLFSNREAFQP